MDATAKENFSGDAPFGAAALTPARQAKLAHDQFCVAQKNTAPSAFGMPVFALILSAIMLQWVPLTELALWLGAVVLGVVPNILLDIAFKRSGKKVGESERWTLTFIIFAVNFAVIWASPVFLFWQHMDTIGHLLWSVVLGCCIAGTAALQAPSPRFAAASIVPYAIAMIVPPLLEGGVLYYGLAGLSVGYVLLMVQLTYHMHITTRDMLMLREDRNDLIEQLTAAKIESDKARLRAEAASQAKSEFLANMSHELRTPLNAILGFSEIMKGEVFGNLGSPQYVEYANHIHGSGQHLLGLINDVLDLSRIEAGRFVIRATELDLREEVRNALSLFEVRATEGSVNLKFDHDPGLPLLLADERAMRQVLFNLISNAVKFTPAGGTVTVFARRTPSGGMDLGVGDTGVGIDPADVNTVFEAFGQGQHDIAVREKGTGLGLPIVRGLVEAHGGKIALTSQLGKGTTVTCTFPRERMTAPQPVPIRLATVL